MNMIEKVAKALFDNTFKGSERFTWEKSKVARNDYCIAAKVAIAAMREPTEEMAKAGANGDDDYFEDFSNGYKRMIDAALKQEDKK